jgi:two-component system phosphate regulon sensor histidine kinase PhoR
VARRWLSYLIRLGAWLAGASAIGLWFGEPAWWLVGALALWLAATLGKLYDLDRILHGERVGAVVDSDGLWAELISRVERYKKRASERKRKYHSLLREVRESTGALRDAGVILNRRNEIQWFNSAAKGLLGLDVNRDSGQRIDSLIRHPVFVAYLAGDGGPEIQIRSPQDPANRLAVQVIPYGRHQRLAVFRDVTQEYRLERMRQDFVANASHELRSPLTVLSGYLDTILDDQEMPATWRGPLEEMQRQSARMTNIIRDLLELSRLESTEIEAVKKAVDVGRILRGIEAEFPTTETGIELTLSIDSDIELLGDETQLHSVFFNLINNAVRFTPRGGRIDVTWKGVASGACFSVHDTGIGIPADLIPRVTERFFRVDPSRSRASGGTGLGLAIVKHVLQNHGAAIRIDSKPGEGSAFYCDFPKSRVVNVDDGQAAHA